MAKKQFRDNDTSGESQSYREDDGASPMWAGFPPATCEDIFYLRVESSIKKITLPYGFMVSLSYHT